MFSSPVVADLLSVAEKNKDCKSERARYLNNRTFEKRNNFTMRKFSLLSLFIFGFLFQNCVPKKITSDLVINKEIINIIKPGIEVLQEQNFEILKGKRVGLVTNPTGVDSKLKSTIDILNEAGNVNLVALFGPEHGVRGNFSAGDQVTDQKDPKTGLPEYSLYGKRKKPLAEVMDLIDVFVYDIQDIGSRSYTYISTMGKIMEQAADFDKEVIVLDRPNPLGGLRVEGPITEDGFISFVSQFKIPYVYGLTCGELASLLNEEGLLLDQKKCKLTVIPMEGWKRSMTYEETGLEWVSTSPHIPNKNSAFYYAATGIIGELDANLIGVGYTLPFQTLATTWLDADELANNMNALNLEGVVFRPIYFKPYYMKMKGEELKGVQIHITDYKAVNLTEIQFYFLEIAHKLNSEIDLFERHRDRISMFNKVSGSDSVVNLISKNYIFSDLKSFWNKDKVSFSELSKKYYLYEK